MDVCKDQSCHLSAPDTQIACLPVRATLIRSRDWVVDAMRRCRRQICEETADCLGCGMHACGEKRQGDRCLPARVRYAQVPGRRASPQTG